MAEFLNMVRQGLGKSMTTLSIRSKELLESNKVNSQIAELERQKKDALVELGLVLCSMLDKDRLNPAPLKSKRSGIATLDKQIKKKQEELVLVHAQAQEALDGHKSGFTCSCGTKVLESARFCTGCGRGIEGAAATN